MAKSNERGPLLFVDTTYKGCRVTEQSFFKTPTQKPKDIVAENYVHSFDRLEESHFQALVPKEDDMQENTNTPMKRSILLLIIIKNLQKCQRKVNQLHALCQK